MAAAKKPAAKRTPRSDTPTVKAVRAELRELDERKPGLKDQRARRRRDRRREAYDDPDTTAAAVVSGLRALERALENLHAQAPEVTKPTEPENELERRRADRAARRAAS
jgi:hypothetical protein